jgi:hypothetical protein
MRKALLTFVVLVFFAEPALAGKPLRSFTIIVTNPKCGSGDEWFDIAKLKIGAGIFPPGRAVIVGYQLWSKFMSAASYVMVGKTQPYGDAITEYLYGTAYTSMIFYPAGTGFPFDPAEAPPTGQLHIHYTCSVDDKAASFGVTLVYTLDSDPSF